MIIFTFRPLCSRWKRSYNNWTIRWDADDSCSSKPVFFSVAQEANSGLGHIVVEVSRSHTIRHTYLVGILWTSDQLVTDAATYTKHNKHYRRKFMPSAGFEPVTPGTKRLDTYALDLTAAPIDQQRSTFVFKNCRGRNLTTTPTDQSYFSRFHSGPQET
jgi:hypothetical protein